MLNEELKKNLKEIFSLQERRVHLSNEFETQFKEYLLDAPNFNLNKLKLICGQTSDQMNLISKRILEIKSDFSEQVFNAPGLFKLVERLQQNEQIKFKLVKKKFCFFFLSKLIINFLVKRL